MQQKWDKDRSMKSSYIQGNHWHSEPEPDIRSAESLTLSSFSLLTPNPWCLSYSNFPEATHEEARRGGQRTLPSERTATMCTHVKLSLINLQIQLNTNCQQAFSQLKKKRGEKTGPTSAVRVTPLAFLLIMPAAASSYMVIGRPGFNRPRSMNDWTSSSVTRVRSGFGSERAQWDKIMSSFPLHHMLTLSGWF